MLRCQHGAARRQGMAWRLVAACTGNNPDQLSQSPYKCPELNLNHPETAWRGHFLSSAHPPSIHLLTVSSD